MQYGREMMLGTPFLLIVVPAWGEFLKVEGGGGDGDKLVQRSP